MQLRIVPTLLAVATLFSALVAAAPVNADADISVSNDADDMDGNMLSKGKTYKGTATWFKPKSEGGPHAACGGKKIDDDSEIVALNKDQYGKMSKDSDWCGKKIKITGPKGSTTATILDACPECKSGDLDLTPVLFQRVAGKMKDGEADITWHLI